MRDAGHITTNILAAIVYPGVAERQECHFEELPNTEGHEARILRGDSELHVVEQIDVFKERSSIGGDLANCVSLDTVMACVLIQG